METVYGEKNNEQKYNDSNIRGQNQIIWRILL